MWAGVLIYLFLQIYAAFAAQCSRRSTSKTLTLFTLEAKEHMMDGPLLVTTVRQDTPPPQPNILPDSPLVLCVVTKQSL